MKAKDILNKATTGGSKHPNIQHKPSVERAEPLLYENAEDIVDQVSLTDVLDGCITRACTQQNMVLSINP